MTDQVLGYLGTVFFALAILHTFLASKILKYSHHFPEVSLKARGLHWLGEIEVIFGLWATVFFVLFAISQGSQAAIKYQNSLNFTEPLFVFVIMVVASTQPVLWAAEKGIAYFSQFLSSLFKLSPVVTDLFSILLLGPLVGSFITEPAAMTVTALLLKNLIVKPNQKMMYALLGVLFVNVSIGGALTPFAAPPILMVAPQWQWDFAFIFHHFGWKSAMAVFVNAILFVSFFQADIKKNCISINEFFEKSNRLGSKQILGLSLTHFVFLGFVVVFAHDPAVFMALFVLFLGLVQMTREKQTPLRLKESLLVAYFLAGIIFFGAFQKWWLQPLLSSLSDSALYFGAVGLTAVTDNAALTYLGAQVEGLSESAKYALVAGAITGGGLTLIANAPNAAGYSLLNDKFQGKIVLPLNLFIAALPPTMIAILFLWFMPF